MGYIILNGEKQATHKFKDTDGKPYEEVKDFDNLALIVPKPFVVYDFDNEKEAKIMLRIIKGLGIKTRVYKTNRGIHCWFRNDEPMKCVNRQRCVIGLIFDRKSHSKNAYVVVKREGKWRDIIIDCKDEDIQPIPRWLGVLNIHTDNTSFVGSEDNSGRNGKLYSYIRTLQNNGYKKKEVKEIINIINDYVFDEPLPEREINTLCRDEAFMSDEEVVAKSQRMDNGKFDHVEVADKLEEQMKFVTVNGILYYKDGQVYKTNDLMVKNRLNNIFLGIKENQRKEVIAYLKSKTVVDADDVYTDPYVLPIRDYKINVITGKIIPYKEDDVFFNIVDVKYDMSAKCEAVENVLNNVFDGRQELIDLFYEMLGTCFVRESVREKAFILLGQGSNGKSTILMMIQHLLKGNYSTLGLEELTERFSTSQIENKLANIGDDIDSIGSKNNGKIKKIIASNEITIEHKGSEPYVIKPTCTHIFSCNKLPKTYDTSEGYFRRFVIVPFNVNFNSSKKNFKPLILNDLKTEAAKSYLFLKGMEGIQRVFKNNYEFTKVAEVENLTKEYKKKSSTVMSWVDDEGISEKDLLSIPRDELYTKYTSWCSNSNISKIVSKIAFYEEIRIQYGFNKDAPQRANGKRYFRKDIEIEFNF